jgi:uncharacterized membrane protein YphA (DoxX/SURF4 family)
MIESRESNSAYWALRVVFGLIPLFAGLDKFTHLLTDWNQYLNPAVLRVLPISANAFMQIAGVVEIIVGLGILFGATRVFGYIAMLWLLGIAANLITQGRFYDVAVRDIGLAVGAFSLARLTEARESAVIVTETDEYRRAA